MGGNKSNRQPVLRPTVAAVVVVWVLRAGVYSAGKDMSNLLPLPFLDRRCSSWRARWRPCTTSSSRTCWSSSSDSWQQRSPESRTRQQLPRGLSWQHCGRSWEHSRQLRWLLMLLLHSAHGAALHIDLLVVVVLLLLRECRARRRAAAAAAQAAATGTLRRGGGRTTSRGAADTVSSLPGCCVVGAPNRCQCVRCD